MQVKKHNKNLGWISLLVVTIMLHGCDSALLNPKGQIGLEQRSLILIAFILMLIVVIPVILMTIVFSYKYRMSNKSINYCPSLSHSMKIEIIVWLIPILIISFLAILTWKTTHFLEPSKPLSHSKKPITIEVVSTDWKWFFIYPDYGIATVNEISFPVDIPIHFKVTSNSVMNSFFIPKLGSQIYAMAGMQTNLYLIANKAGIYDGISANYSGSGFSGMKFKAIVKSDYNGFCCWIKKVKQSLNIVDNIFLFEKIAIPSQYNTAEYFSKVKPNLFKNIIDKIKSERINKGMKHIKALSK